MYRLAFLLCTLQLTASAATLYHHARVHIFDAKNSTADWLLVRDGKVADYGRGKPKATPPDATKVDLGGKWVTPALTDAHAHLVEIGETAHQPDLRGAKSEAEAVGRVKKYFEKDEGDDTLIGTNWDQSDWPGGAFPTRASLDAAFPKRPVILNRVDGHAAWVNTPALKAAGLMDVKADPTGGKILRDDKGLPTGVLVDTAMDALDKITATPDDARLDRDVAAAVEKAWSYGMVGMHDAAAHPEHVEAIRRFLKRGGRFRFYEMIAIDDANALDRYLAKGKVAEPFLTVRTVKLFADGAMGSRGAAFEAPYSDDPKNSGLLRFALPELAARIKMIDARGFQVAVHAIGDRANKETIDAFEQALGRNIATKRPRLEHAQVMREMDFKRVAKDGIIASMQPVHWTSDKKWVVERIGPKRAKFAYAWPLMLKAGATLAFGSDAPVEDLNPWHGIDAAVTKIPRREAFRAFTLGAAKAAFAEDTQGSLQRGRHADFFISTGDPLKADVKVEATYVGGERAWPSSPRT